MVSLLSLCILATGPLQVGQTLNPALSPSAKEIMQAWEKGWADAPKLKNPDEANKISRKVIFRHKISVLLDEPCSWLYFLHPKFFAYNLGFYAKRKYWTEKEISEAKEWLSSSDCTNPNIIVFFGDINLLPDFSGGYGRIKKQADPRDLVDIRVVLKVGSRVYQPIEQPGTLQASIGNEINVTNTPSFNYGWSQATVTATSGRVFGTANVYTRYSELTQTTSSQSYKTYHGSFAVAFQLYDEDGTPRIRKEDKEFIVAVVFTSGEHQAKYNLNDWLNSFK